MRRQAAECRAIRREISRRMVPGGLFLRQFILKNGSLLLHKPMIGPMSAVALFKFQKKLFYIQSPGVARQCAVISHDAVTWYDY